MKKFLKYMLIILLLGTVIAAGLWVFVRPRVVSGVEESLKTLGFSQPGFALLPQLDGHVTLLVTEGGLPILEAQIDMASVASPVLQISDVIVSLENWPQGQDADVDFKAQAAALWQVLSTPVQIPALSYQKIEVADVHVLTLSGMALSGQITATQQMPGVWQAVVAATLDDGTTLLPLNATATVTPEGRVAFDAALDPVSLFMPWGLVKQFAFSVTVAAGGPLPMLSASLSADAVAGASGVKLRLNPQKVAGGQIPFEVEASYNRAPLKLAGLLDFPGFRATATPSGTLVHSSVTATGIKGQLSFDPLWPLTLPAGQVLEASVVEAGLPFTAPRVVFGYQDHRLKLTDARALIFGGTMTLEPVVLALPLLRAVLVATVSNLDLAQALLMVNVDGLSGTGSLTGRIPLSYANGKLSFGETSLKSGESGTILYQPATPPAFMAEGGQGELLGQVFSNFAYDGLTLKLGGTMGDNLTLGARLEGRNPSFYNGHPVAFNLNLSGALDSVLKNGLANFNFSPEALGNLMQFDQGAPTP